MKRILFAFLLSAFLSHNFFLNAQADQPGKSQNFFEIQESFYDYWEPFNLEDGYYIDENGVRQKAAGWKQFKRWEWFWETRVDPTTGEFPRTSAAEVRQQIRSSRGTNSDGANWTGLGPDSSPGGYAGLGRLNCVAFSETDPDIMYVGSPSGGLWKTTDGCTTWTVLTDENDILGVSDAIVFDGTTTDSDTVYIATGDRDGGILGRVGYGHANDNNSIGVLKSVDGGATWSPTGLTFSPSDKKTVNRLLVEPSNHDVIIASATDGVYKTTDGGTTWPKISSITDLTDMEFHPTNSSIIYGSTRWESDVYLSIDGGLTWVKTLDNFGDENGNRTELAVSPDEPDWVYAVVSDGPLEGVYKSTDSGNNWTQVFDGNIPGNHLLGWQCDASDDAGMSIYCLCIAADPNDASVVFLGGINTWKSTDGGLTWNISNFWHESSGCDADVAHADKHFLAYQPGTNDLFECNDGGLYKTTDGGTTWPFLGSGLIISQLYRLGVSQLTADNIIIGLQDNGTKSLLSGTWADVKGGDGMDCFIDYTDDDTQYTEGYFGKLARTTDGWISRTSIYSDISGSAAWVTPFSIDPLTHTTLYVGYDTVWKSTNQGTNWSKISDFLAGGTLRSLAVAPSNPDTIYVATLKKLWATYNGGTSWSEKTGTLPVGSSYITSISINSDFADTLWVTMGEYNSYAVFQSNDAGATWTDISSGLPSIPVMCVIQNKLNTSEIELYAATDVGVYVKQGNTNWTPFNEGLPNVVVVDLDIYYDNTTPGQSMLRAATYGRGLWETSLSGPLQIVSESFDTDLGNMMTYSVTGDQVWEWANFGNPPGCAKMTGYDGGQTYENEDWLITPPLNHFDYNDTELTFDHARNYGSNADLFVLVSNDYDGTSNPTEQGIWTDITSSFIFPDPGSWTFIDAGSLDLSPYIGDSVFVAFKYTCGTSASSTWEIDNISITGASIVTQIEEGSPVSERAHIYSSRNTIYIQFRDFPQEPSLLSIFNTLGQQVYHGELTPQNLSTIQLNEKPGIYIVRLQTQKGLITQKVMIK